MNDKRIYYSRCNLDTLSKYMIPNRCGAYVITHITNNHVEKYVGSTENLQRRKYGHHNKNVIHIDLFVTDDIFLAQRVEEVLIYMLKPASNHKTYTITDDDKILMNELIEGLTDEERYKVLREKEFKIGYRYLKYVNKDNETHEDRIQRKKRINAMVSDEAKKKLIDYQKRRNYSTLDEAFDAFILGCS